VRRARTKNLFGFGSKKPSGCATKSSLTIGQAKRAAFSEGRKTGDSRGFKDWTCRRGLQDRGTPTLKALEDEFKRGVAAGRINSFEASNRIKEIAFDQGYQDETKHYDRNLQIDEIMEYFSGQYDKDALIDVLGKSRIKSLYTHEYRQGKNKARKEASREMKFKQTTEAKERKAKAKKRVGSVRGKAIYKVGDHYEIQGGDSEFDSKADAKNFIESNPAKFDRCVRDVQKAARKTGKPVNAYAVCTAAGTRATGNPVRTIYATFRTKEDSGDGRPGWELQPEGAKWPIAEAVHLSKDATPERIQREAQAFFSEDIKIVKRSSSAGNPVTSRNALWKVTQGKIKGEVKREGKRFLGLVTSQHGTQHHIFNSLKGAQAWVRDEVFSMASNPANLGALASGILQGVGTHVGTHALGKLKHTRGKVSKRRNPEAQAAVAFEQFTGFPSGLITKIEETEHVHSVTWSAGQLIALVLVDVHNKPIELLSNGWSYEGPKADIAGKPTKSANGWQFDPATTLDEITWLTCSEKGDQLFIQGGDQKLDVKALGFEASDVHDHMLIGTILRIWYRARKTFEAQGREPVDFYHDFGKEGSKGVCPVLMYKPRDPSLQIAGGRYTIAKPDSSLGGVSPGIVG